MAIPACTALQDSLHSNFICAEVNMKSLVFGVGTNDADYPVQVYENLGYSESGKRLKKLIWACPYYQRWVNMLRRCYSSNYHEKFPSYIGCSVFEPWLIFTTFKAWMQTQDWEGKHLDKDLLVKGNKTYSPQTCVFLDEKVNYFISENKSCRGEFPIGVSWHKSNKKFVAQISYGSGVRKHLGFYDTAEEAHDAWLSAKRVRAEVLARQQVDKRVAKVLLERYENYVF